MPYNNTPVPPPKDVTGQLSLPLARIKKIINIDDDVNSCSSNAAFIITIATEMFIQYLTEEGHKMVKSEKRPRKNLQYQDLANAVSRIDNLEFLSDVIPRTTTYKKFVEQRGKNFKPGDSVSATKAAAGGQTELSFMSGGSKPHVDILHPAEGTNGKGNSTEPEVIEDDGEDEDEMDVDEEYKASGGAIEDDIQEQLAMEMGHHTTTNGR